MVIKLKGLNMNIA